MIDTTRRALLVFVFHAGCYAVDPLPVAPDEVCRVELEEPKISGGASDPRDCYWGSNSPYTALMVTVQLRDPQAAAGAGTITQISVSTWHDPPLRDGESMRLDRGDLQFNVRSYDPNGPVTVALDDFAGTVHLVSRDPWWRLEFDGTDKQTGAKVSGALWRGK